MIWTVNLQVRPLHHRSANRVRAHIFLCMLIRYFEGHMREAWRPLLLSDTELGNGIRTRDLVALAPAERKAAGGILDYGTPAHRFRTLI